MIIIEMVLWTEQSEIIFFSFFLVYFIVPTTRFDSFHCYWCVLFPSEFILIASYAKLCMLVVAFPTIRSIPSIWFFFFFSSKYRIRCTIYGRKAFVCCGFSKMNPANNPLHLLEISYIFQFHLIKIQKTLRWAHVFYVIITILDAVLSLSVYCLHSNNSFLLCMLKWEFHFFTRSCPSVYNSVFFFLAIFTYIITICYAYFYSSIYISTECQIDSTVLFSTFSNAFFRLLLLPRVTYVITVSLHSKMLLLIK